MNARQLIQRIAKPRFSSVCVVRVVIFKSNMWISLAFALVLTIGTSSAQDANCDFVQNVQAGLTYYVYSPNYPQNYRPGVQCRWVGICPSGYNCRLDCTDVSLPQTSGCSLDRLLISKSGDPQLTSADYYCGKGTVTAVSTGQRISVGLITSTQSPGGRFLCQLTAQAATTNPTCSCGYKKTNRIVGGQQTGVNEFPMMAGLAHKDIAQIKCGAVIISKRYVMTAAHCLTGQSLSNLAIIVGEHDVTVGDSPATQGFQVISAIIHPNYTPSNYDYDIAILKTNADITFSDRVGPVCLPFKFVNTDFTGSKLTILGWGTQFPGGPTSNYLQKVDVDVISQSSCRNVVPTLTARQICTYTPGKDACQDDSGGPLLYTDSSNGLLYSIGIVSNGRFCAGANQPGVNTRVPALLSWIQTNTPDASYCYK
ncbi:venom serine protease 34-like [Ostrinia nubilalis]|uniref:venom serine protease 34-like n=1 Tax=Ostrinia nubilalis TaxID=29057 RepID=UPI0030822270